MTLTQLVSHLVDLLALKLLLQRCSGHTSHLAFANTASISAKLLAKAHLASAVSTRSRPTGILGGRPCTGRSGKPSLRLSSWVFNLAFSLTLSGSITPYDTAEKKFWMSIWVRGSRVPSWRMVLSPLCTLGGMVAMLVSERSKHTFCVGMCMHNHDSMFSLTASMCWAAVQRSSITLPWSLALVALTYAGLFWFRRCHLCGLA